MSVLNISEWKREDAQNVLQWLEDAPQIFWQYVAALEETQINSLILSKDTRDDDELRGSIKTLKKLVLLHDKLLNNLQANTQEDIDSN